jgi:hypothetical protein
MKFNRPNSIPGLSSRSCNQETSDETNAPGVRLPDIQRPMRAIGCTLMAMLRASPARRAGIAHGDAARHPPRIDTPETGSATPAGFAKQPLHDPQVQRICLPA